MAGTARETSLIFLTRILLTLEDDSTSTPTILRKINQKS
jgi:hypothetical protein